MIGGIMGDACDRLPVVMRINAAIRSFCLSLAGSLAGDLGSKFSVARRMGCPDEEERMSWSSTAPHGAFDTFYLVLESFGARGTTYRETDVERADLETVIGDLLAGEFNAPVRVVAFNTREHWAGEVSRQIAEEIQERCDIAGEPVPEHIRDFVEDHTSPTRQLALRVG